MKVYISGPMTGIPHFNYPLFHAAASAIERHGDVALNPASQPIQPGQTRARYLRKDLLLLAEADAITFLPDWEHSPGAKLECAIAQQIGLLYYDRSSGRTSPLFMHVKLKY